MSYFNNYFSTPDKRKKFYETKGFDDQNVIDVYDKAFQAADKGGQNYLSNYDFGNATNIDWDDFSSGMASARQSGWDDWWNTTKRNDPEPFGLGLENWDNIPGVPTDPVDFANWSEDLFSSPDFSFSGSANPWDAMLANNPNYAAYQDVTQNTETTRKATQADVDSGLATMVGEDIKEYNIPSLFDAQKASYFESFKDIIDKNKLQEVSAMDLMQQLKNLSQTASGELSNSLDLYKTEQEGNITSGETTRDTDIDTLMNALKGQVSIYGDDLQKVIDTFYTEQKATDDAYETALNTGITDYQTSKEEALTDLYNARSDNVLSKYKGITDALRSDNMLAKRAGEFGTSGSTNKMLIDAAMRAASDKQGVLGDLYEQMAQEQFNIDNEVASLSKSVDDMSANLDKSRAEAESFEEKELKGFSADQKFEIENNRAMAKKGVDDWRNSESFGLYTQLSSARKGLRDRLAEQEKQFGVQFQNSLKQMRDEFAIAIGATPDETDPIMQLVNEFISLEAARGKLNILEAEEYYEANKNVLQDIVDNPNSFLQLLGMQVADRLAAIGYEDQILRSQLSDRFNNIGDITAIIEGLADYENNEELRAITEQLNALSSGMQGMQGTLGTNPTQAPNITIPDSDLSGLAEIMSQITDRSNISDDASSKLTNWLIDNLDNILQDEEVTDESETTGDGGT